MFGYVVPDKTKISKEDLNLYGAFYCGICKTIKQEYGQRARIFTTYDLTFLSILSHDCRNYPVQFNKERCSFDFMKNKVVVKSSDYMRALCSVGVLLSLYKIEDDVIDGNKGRKALLGFYKAQAKKARAIFPEADEVIKRRYDELREMEKNNESSIDKVADSFGLMLKDLCLLLVENADEQLLSLCYNIGKYVYIIDALDDLEKDAKSGNYNPFLIKYGKESLEALLIDRKEEVEFLVATTINRAIESFNNRKYHQSYSLLRNIVWYGLRKRADEVMQRKKVKPVL